MRLLRESRRVSCLLRTKAKDAQICVEAWQLSCARKSACGAPVEESRSRTETCRPRRWELQTGLRMINARMMKNWQR